MPGPFERQDPVNVIRHQGERVDLGLGEMVRYRDPAGDDDSAKAVWLHRVVHDLSEHAGTTVSADRDEVRTDPAVVEVL